jgi:hypothetical protein
MCCQAGCFFQSHLIYMSPFAPLACLLAHLEDRFRYLVEDLLGFEPRREAPPQLIAAGLARGWQAAPAGATSSRYVVRPGELVAYHVARGPGRGIICRSMRSALRHR